MKPKHIDAQPQWLAELFADQQARHLGKPKPATITNRDIDKIRTLFAEGVTYDEAKTVVRYVFHTQAGGYWRERISDVSGFVNAYDTLVERVAKHVGSTASSATVNTSVSSDGPRQRLGRLSDERRAEDEARASDPDPIVFDDISADIRGLMNRVQQRAGATA